ncbi:nitrate reductase NapE component [Pseudochelatococcus contaminans]|uniref:Nitrate reductase NapE component n=1 Tax=Pseudochelatococcus contaminans TaxID=1538103 RepID=A0A7W5Z791_9HYPH|nr:nitrate reductase NapE component [Pseudochelatococcus contaminans]
MGSAQKLLALSVFLVITILAYLLRAGMTEAISQNIVTFMSIAFGFYMTSVAVLSGSGYARYLYGVVQKNRRGIHVLRDYFRVGGLWSLSSIAMVMIYTIVSRKDVNGYLYIADISGQHSAGIFSVDLGSLLLSCLFGIVSVNFILMTFIFNVILDNLVASSVDQS